MTNSDIVGLAELKPCPFCGRGPEIFVRDWSDAEQDVGNAYVWCPRCKIEQPYFQNEAQAIAAWNTRPTPGEDKPLGIEEVELAVARAIHDALDLSDGLKLDMATEGQFSKVARAAIEAYEQATLSGSPEG